MSNVLIERGAVRRRSSTEKNDISVSDSIDEKSINSSSTEDIPKLGAPLLQASEVAGFPWPWRRQKLDLDAIATQPSVFDDSITLKAYYPPAEYENTHRFDPLARWTWREEKALVRKVDVRIMIWACVMFFSLELDRSNIAQANADNFLEDLNITTNDFNLGNILFRLSFLCAELPSQLISKRIGPDVWVPCQMVLWSLVAMFQFFLNGRTSFLVFRFLLGFLQGGFIPDIVLYLSYYYTKSELPIRLAFFWVSNYFADMCSAFLATGILRLRGVGGHAGWRYLFLLEGAVTLIVGIAAFFLMPPGPTQTKAWYRPKGWFTDREEVIMVNRVLRDDPSKSSMHNREGLSISMIYEALRDWRLWPIYALGLVHLIPVLPPQTYLTLSLRSIGFDTTQTNLLSVPSLVLGVIGLVTIAYLSEVTNNRVFTAVILQVWALPLLCALYTFDANTSQWVYFAVVSLIAGFPYVHPVQVAWTSRNSNSVRTRTVSASVYNMFVQVGIIVQANIYRKDDKPLYKRGNRDLIAICSMNIVLYVLAFFFYRTLNARRQKRWEAMSVKEQEDYIENTTDKGNERLDFRFAY